MEVLEVVLFRTGWNYDRDEASFETGVDCSQDEVLAVQSACEECDINTIVRRFGLTGQMPSVARVPMYGDFTDIDDYRSALEAVRDAEANFMSYPAALRARFDNDPQLFLEFCGDERNLPEMRKLGLAVPAVPSPAAAAGGGDGSAGAAPVAPVAGSAA